MADTAQQYTNQQKWLALREIDKTGELVLDDTLKDRLIQEGLVEFDEEEYDEDEAGLDLTDKGWDFYQDEGNYPNA